MLMPGLEVEDSQAEGVHWGFCLRGREILGDSSYKKLVEAVVLSEV